MIALMVEEDDTKRRHHAPEQIVRKLSEAGRLLGEGFSIVAVCKHLEVTEQTYYRRRNQSAVLSVLADTLIAIGFQ
jgi:predicted nuclease of restriction endonuclease-like (RecB) superfamily